MTEAAHTALGTIPRRGKQYVKCPTSGTNRRVYVMDLMRSRQTPPSGLLSWIGELGFDTLLLSLPQHFGTADIGDLPPIVDAAAASGLNVHLDLTLNCARETGAIVKRHPDWFRATTRRAADPRETPAPAGLRRLDLRTAAAIDAFAEQIGRAHV